MEIFTTVQLSQTETINKTAAKLASDLLQFLGGNPATDTSQVTIVSVANAPPPAP